MNNGDQTIMTTDELAKTLKSYKGPIFVELGNSDYYIWVKIDKADLKRQMKLHPELLENIYIVDRYGMTGLYLGSANR